MTLEEYQDLSAPALYEIIAELNSKYRALFLVHNYQRLEVQHPWPWPRPRPDPVPD